jgi:hypothetical protein
VKPPKLILQDCLLALKALSDDSLDSLVTDPPAGILTLAEVTVPACANAPCRSVSVRRDNGAVRRVRAIEEGMT